MKHLNDFLPPLGLRNPHLQTIGSSLVRKHIIARHYRAKLEAGTNEVIEVCDVKLLVHSHFRVNAPTVVLIPGWLGSAQSSYVQGAAVHLYEAGFSVVRVNLRDHGGTANLNPGLFHSALIDEVVMLIQHLIDRNSKPTGIMGFSLGGNFALRVARALPGLPTLAIAPAIEPANTMLKIDQNVFYQRYFINKWRRTWADKQAAYPDLYDFTPAMKISSVSALTDYFIRYHADFDTTDGYFQAYDLSDSALEGVRARVLAAHDDPIIPINQFSKLPGTIQVETTQYGGHTAYLKNYRFESWLDAYAEKYFAAELALHSI
jgi:predicted alpha/beta-fold hydrolase